MMKDKQLIDGLRHGDMQVLGCIYDRFRVDMLKLGASLLNDRHLAEDIVHETFCRLIDSPPRMLFSRSLKGYLLTAVANRCRNACRDGARRKTVPLLEALDSESSDISPQAWLIADEEFCRIARALSNLPYDQREVIVLHLQGDLVFKKIAKVQDVSIKTVQSRYRYGIQKMRSLLNVQQKGVNNETF